MVSGPKLLTLVRRAIRLRHYSRHTEEAYVAWVRRFVRFAGLRHPSELGEAEVRAFLEHLAERDQVSASTQNQAVAALLFLYEAVLGRRLAVSPQGVVHAKELQRLPVVLSREEVRAVLAQLRGVAHLVALLLYGSGLRLLECLSLRVYSRRCGVVAMPPRGRSGGITCTSRPFSVPSGTPCAGPGSRNGRPVIRFAIPSPPISSRRGPTSGPCRSFWGIATSAPP